MRTSLVTGTSRGLGREVANELTKRGLRVLFTSRAGEEREEVERLRLRGASAEWRALDVVDRESIASLKRTLESEAISLDVLVNNAGIALKGFNAEIARRTIEVNFFGALHLTDALLPLIVDGGTIVMVSSGIGELAGLDDRIRAELTAPDLDRERLSELVRRFVRDVEIGEHAARGWPSSAYRVSKLAMNALTRILARELSPRKIRVNAVCPGWVRTDLGGSQAPRSLEEGARSIVWAALLEDDTTGGFFRDGQRIAW